MRSKKLILVCHCVLNQNSVINDWERAKGAFSIVAPLLHSGAGIIQLPCPELVYKGINRPPLEYEDYDTLGYRALSRQLLAPYILQLKDYISNGYKLQGIVGIHNSPSCSITGQRGVFMEELFDMCSQENIALNYVEVPEEYQEHGDNHNLIRAIKNFIMED